MHLRRQERYNKTDRSATFNSAYQSIRYGARCGYRGSPDRAAPAGMRFPLNAERSSGCCAATRHAQLNHSGARCDGGVRSSVLQKSESGEESKAAAPKVVAVALRRWRSPLSSCICLYDSPPVDIPGRHEAITFESAESVFKLPLCARGSRWWCGLSDAAEAATSNSSRGIQVRHRMDSRCCVVPVLRRADFGARTRTRDGLCRLRPSQAVQHSTGPSAACVPMHMWGNIRAPSGRTVSRLPCRSLR